MWNKSTQDKKIQIYKVIRKSSYGNSEPNLTTGHRLWRHLWCWERTAAAAASASHAPGPGTGTADRRSGSDIHLTISKSSQSRRNWLFRSLHLWQRQPWGATVPPAHNISTMFLTARPLTLAKVSTSNTTPGDGVTQFWFFWNCCVILFPATSLFFCATSLRQTFCESGASVCVGWWRRSGRHLATGRLLLLTVSRGASGACVLLTKPTIPTTGEAK